jgi:hypothetical protein
MLPPAPRAPSYHPPCMTWDADQWRRRFEIGADDARRYVRENRTRIAKNDPRSEAAKLFVDHCTAEADLYDQLLGSTDSRRALTQRIEQLSTGAIRAPSGIYERARYEAEWRRACEALSKELAATDGDS